MKTPLFILILSALTLPNAFASRRAGDDFVKYFPEMSPFSSKENLAEDAALRQVDWAQPPVGCVEEMVPHRASRPCPDFSQVAKPQSEWPAMSAADKAYWWKERRGISICRAEEILRREQQQPGSQSSTQVELSWMTVDSLRDADKKVAAVYEAARLHGIPLQVLTGAIYQESMFSQLGISDDGGNFSCGMQQGNVIGWCNYMNKQSPELKKAMSWPEQPVKCFYTAEELQKDPNPVKVVDTEFMRPAFEFAKARNRGAAYRITKEHFAGITPAQLYAKWPAADEATNKLRFQVIKSFIHNCSDARIGVLQKANELKMVYDDQVADLAFAARDRYTGGQKFQRQCREDQVGDAYPLHIGWLMVVASYNGGPRAIDAAAAYEGWGLADLRDPVKTANYTPLDFIKGMYWGGKYNPSNDLIEYPWLKRPGVTRQWPFFKACVAQRHIARVMQHVTLTPEYFSESLEGSWGCQRGTFPNGPSGTPAERQRSSGHK